MKILNIGCGMKKMETAINLDKSGFVKPDIIWDLEKTPLPFENNDFNMVFASHTLEHINNFFSLMEELYRILKPEGILDIKVPHYTSPTAHYPDHKRCFCWDSFNCFVERNMENYFSKARFKIIYRELAWRYYNSKTKINIKTTRFGKFFEKFIPLRFDELRFLLKKVIA